MQYFIFTSLFAFWVFLSNNTKSSKELVYIYYLFVLIIALAIGLRGNYDEYTRVYVLIPTLSDFFSGNYPVINEKGWVFGFISSIFRTIGFNSQSIFLFFSSTAVFIHAIYFRKYTKYYFLAFLIYLSHEILLKEWIGLRMGFASALLLPMIYYLDAGEKIKFLFLALIATLVQYVAVLSFLLYFLNYRIRPRYLLFGLLIAVVLSKSGIVYNVFWWLDSAKYLPSLVSSYLGDEVYVYDAGISHLKTIQQIMIVLILIVLFGYNKRTFQGYHLFFNAYYLGTVFLIMFSEVALFAFRFAGHFSSVEPILVVYIIATLKQRRMALNIITVVTLMMAYLNYVIIERVPAYDLFVNYPA